MQARIISDQAAALSGDKGLESLVPVTERHNNVAGFSSESEGTRKMNLPEPVLDMLEGKRCGVIGFEPSEANAMLGVLNDIHAFARTVDVAQIRSRPLLLNTFDLCICDISTFQPIAESLRLCDGGIKTVLVVGSPEEVMQEALNHQCEKSDFLFKPWAPHDLVLRSFKLLRQGEDIVVLRPIAPEEQTVIVVDDDATTTTLIADLFDSNQLKSVLAHDGTAGLEAARSLQGQVMVLDINMPDLSGFEVLKAIKDDKATRQIKVIMLTAREREVDIVRAFSLGADDYVVKPFKRLELVARVKRLLGDDH